MKRITGWQYGVVIGILASGGMGRAQDVEHEPINYSKATAANAISRLQARLEAGQAKLGHDREQGYLKDVLRELRVPIASQVLVFSRTSLQRHRITPRTPRAVYFNDEIYIGYCMQGDVLEIAAADPQLGTVFYTLDQAPGAKPTFRRQTDNCLICHGSSFNQGVPGHLVRSVYTDPRGEPVLSAGSYRTDQTSPFDQRWGGWYVTGKHGKQMHMGNWIVRGKGRPELTENDAGQNVTSLKELFTVGNYLSPHSDLVALMVLEHQAEMHNRIARATVQTRQALHMEKELNREMGRPLDERWPSTETRIRAACDPLVKYLLFSGETKLAEPVEGTSSFVRDFVQAGPRDRQGRSLRDFNLKHRLFRYPCSYLIYSSVFDALPPIAKDQIWRRLYDVLTGKDTSADFAHLSTDDRRSILAILRETKADLPAYWRQ